MIVKVFSDAGYSHTAKIASWGAWAISERGVARSGGILKVETHHSTLLEAAAMVNAVKMALIFKVLQRGDEMLLHTDNDSIDDFLSGKHQWKGPLPGLIHGEFMRTCMHYGLDYEWKHVKGHAGNASPNCYCDRVARFFLRLERHRRDPEKFPTHPLHAPYGIKVPPEFAGKIKPASHEQVVL